MEKNMANHRLRDRDKIIKVLIEFIIIPIFSIGTLTMAQNFSIPSNSETVRKLLVRYGYSPSSIRYDYQIIDQYKASSIISGYQVLNYSEELLPDKAIKSWSLHDNKGYVASVDMIYFDKRRDMQQAIAYTFDGYSIMIENLELSSISGIDIIIKFPESDRYIGISAGNLFFYIRAEGNFDTTAYANSILDAHNKCAI